VISEEFQDLFDNGLYLHIDRDSLVVDSDYLTWEQWARLMAYVTEKRRELQ
jgi:hypothetical protein